MKFKCDTLVGAVEWADAVDDNSVTHNEAITKKKKKSFSIQSNIFFFKNQSFILVNTCDEVKCP